MQKLHDRHIVRKTHGHRAAGWVLVEALLSLTILGTMLAGFSVSLGRFRSFNAIQMARQRCIAAGQAQLDGLSATGQGLTDEQIEKFWPKIEVRTSFEPGRKQWEGLTKVQVTARTVAAGRGVSISLGRYIRPAEER